MERSRDLIGVNIPAFGWKGSGILQTLRIEVKNKYIKYFLEKKNRRNNDGVELTR